MKKLFPLTLLAAIALAWGGCQTESTPHGTVVVNYDHPENYTDFKSNFREPTSQAYMDDLRHHLVVWAAKSLPVGQTLTITFTEIDMAGEIKPSQDTLRINRALYPLKLDFTWVITDASGKVVKQGKENIVNLFTGAQTGYDRNDPLFHEKDQMDDWVRQTLR